MRFEELSHFTIRVVALLDDESYGELQMALHRRPDLGRLIRGSGGLRKVRWAAKGRGKRGGVRVIYYWWVADSLITFCDIYPKTKKKTSPAMKSKNSASNLKAKPAGRQYRRLSAALDEMKAIRRGELAPARSWEIVPDGRGGFIRREITARRRATPKPASSLALEAREKLGLSQSDFAALIGVNAGTLRGWEQGRREPNRAARVLLAVAAREPGAVLAAAKVA